MAETEIKKTSKAGTGSEKAGMPTSAGASAASKAEIGVKSSAPSNAAAENKNTPGSDLIIKLREGLYQIKVKIPTPLRYTNAYLITGSDRNILIDTGYRSDPCIGTIKSAMSEIGCSLSDTDILLTHFHDDHSGASTSLIAPGRKIYYPEGEAKHFGITSNERISDPAHVNRSSEPAKGNRSSDPAKVNSSSEPSKGNRSSDPAHVNRSSVPAQAGASSMQADPEQAGASTEKFNSDAPVKLPQSVYDATPDTFYKESRRSRYLSEGLTSERFDDMMDYRAIGAIGPDMSCTAFTPVHDHDIICAGDFKLEAVHTPGHTPGHMCYWEPDKKILFTGDHILFDITSNIIFWKGIDDILGTYLDSVRKMRDYPAELICPGHRESGDLNERVRQLLSHHDDRLRRCEEIIKEYPGCSSMDVTECLTWKVKREPGSRRLPILLLRYAYGETIAHLDHLCAIGRIDRVVKNGTGRYYISRT